MTNKMERYQKIEIIEHLASQFVLGTLSNRVQKRITSLCQNNPLLEQRINFWQDKLVSIDKQTNELPPSEYSWSVISNAIDIQTNIEMLTTKNNQLEQEKQTILSLVKNWLSNTRLLSAFLSTPLHRLTSAFSIVTLVLASLIFINPLANDSEPLSYVAVLTTNNGDAHLVATTYGESRKLVVNVVNAPNIDKKQNLELWVVSKRDKQVRSLGIIKQGESLIEQQLTIAQWRLIKDSKSLIVTIEDLGGSPIGEPSDLVVSKGLCIRLQEWKKNV